MIYCIWVLAFTDEVSMTPTDLRVLCTALGFTAVVMQGEKLPKKEGALRAASFAHLIEAFCLETVPHAINDNGSQSEFARAEALRERMANAVADTIKKSGECTAKDLLAQGFTPVEVEKHWPMAYALARVKLNMMDS